MGSRIPPSNLILDGSYTSNDSLDITPPSSPVWNSPNVHRLRSPTFSSTTDFRKQRVGQNNMNNPAQPTTTITSSSSSSLSGTTLPLTAAGTLSLGGSSNSSSVNLKSPPRSLPGTGHRRTLTGPVQWNSMIDVMSSKTDVIFPPEREPVDEVTLASLSTLVPSRIIRYHMKKLADSAVEAKTNDQPPETPGMSATKRANALYLDSLKPFAEKGQCAVLFADISGFSKLAESLVKRLSSKSPSFSSKEAQTDAEYGAAEKLSQYVGSSLHKMVEAIVNPGGDVIKFAGDAILAIFPAANYENDLSKAVLCCAQVAREIVSLRLQNGKTEATLSIHCGMGCGEVTSFHVGGLNNRWEYFVTGTPVEEIGETEPLAKAGEVVISTSCYKLISEHCTGRIVEKGNFKLETIKDAKPFPLVFPIRSEIEEFCLGNSAFSSRLKAALRCYIPRPALQAVGSWTSQLRICSSVFCKIHNLKFDLDESIDIVQHVMFRIIQKFTQEFSGTVCRFIVDDKGAVILLAFGLPPASREDAKNSCRAALKIHEAILSYKTNVKLGCSIGISRGPVWCGTVGGDTRCEYTVHGKIVNIAARIMGEAKGGVLCDVETFKNVNGMEFSEPTSARLKGVSEQTLLYRPLRVTSNNHASYIGYPFLSGDTDSKAKNISPSEVLGLPPLPSYSSPPTLDHPATKLEGNSSNGSSDALNALIQVSNGSTSTTSTVQSFGDYKNENYKAPNSATSSPLDVRSGGGSAAAADGGFYPITDFEVSKNKRYDDSGNFHDKIPSHAPTASGNTSHNNDKKKNKNDNNTSTSDFSSNNNTKQRPTSSNFSGNYDAPDPKKLSPSKEILVSLSPMSENSTDSTAATPGGTPAPLLNGKTTTSANKDAISPIENQSKRPVSAALQPPIIAGREEEIELIESMLSKLKRESSYVGTLLVEGEAGIGKSKLCRFLSSRATESNLLVFGGFGFESESSTSFSLWSTVLLELVDYFASTHPQLIRQTNKSRVSKPSNNTRTTTGNNRRNRRLSAPSSVASPVPSQSAVGRDSQPLNSAALDSESIASTGKDNASTSKGKQQQQSKQNPVSPSNNLQAITSTNQSSGFTNSSNTPSQNQTGTFASPATIYSFPATPAGVMNTITTTTSIPYFRALEADVLADEADMNVTSLLNSFNDQFEVPESQLELRFRALEELIPNGMEDLTPLLSAILPEIVEIKDNDVTVRMIGESRGRGLTRLIVEILKKFITDIEKEFHKRFVFIFEDLQWVDPESLDALVEASKELESVLICMSVRDARRELGERCTNVFALPNFELIHLENLTKEQLRDGIAHWMGVQEVSFEAVDAIYNRSTGQPLFAEELCREMRDREIVRITLDENGANVLEMNPNAESVELLPHSISELMVTRLDRLSPSEQVTVKAASVIGVEFRKYQVTGILAKENSLSHTQEMVDADVNSLVQLGIFLESTYEGSSVVYRFAHVMLRDTAYGLLPFELRKELHRRVAEFIQNRSSFSNFLTANHYFLAEQWNTAVEYLELAGEEALEIHGMHQVLSCFSRLLQIADLKLGKKDLSVLKKAGWCRKASEALLDMGRREEAEAGFLRALQMLELDCRAVGKKRRSMNPMSGCFNLGRKSPQPSADTQDGGGDEEKVDDIDKVLHNGDSGNSQVGSGGIGDVFFLVKSIPTGAAAAATGGSTTASGGGHEPRRSSNLEQAPRRSSGLHVGGHGSLAHTQSAHLAYLNAMDISNGVNHILVTPISLDGATTGSLNGNDSKLVPLHLDPDLGPSPSLGQPMVSSSRGIPRMFSRSVGNAAEFITATTGDQAGSSNMNTSGSNLLTIGNGGTSSQSFLPRRSFSERFKIGKSTIGAQSSFSKTYSSFFSKPLKPRSVRHLPAFIQLQNEGAYDVLLEAANIYEMLGKLNEDRSSSEALERRLNAVYLAEAAVVSKKDVAYAELALGYANLAVFFGGMQPGTSWRRQAHSYKVKAFRCREYHDTMRNPRDNHTTQLSLNYLSGQIEAMTGEFFEAENFLKKAVWGCKFLRFEKMKLEFQSFQFTVGFFKGQFGSTCNSIASEFTHADDPHILALGARILLICQAFELAVSSIEKIARVKPGTLQRRPDKVLRSLSALDDPEAYLVFSMCMWRYMKNAPLALAGAFAAVESMHRRDLSNMPFTTFHTAALLFTAIGDVLEALDEDPQMILPMVRSDRGSLTVLNYSSSQLGKLPYQFSKAATGVESSPKFNGMTPTISPFKQEDQMLSKEQAFAPNSPSRKYLLNACESLKSQGLRCMHTMLAISRNFAQVYTPCLPHALYCEVYTDILTARIGSRSGSFTSALNLERAGGNSIPMTIGGKNSQQQGPRNSSLSPLRKPSEIELQSPSIKKRLARIVRLAKSSKTPFVAGLALLESDGDEGWREALGIMNYCNAPFEAERARVKLRKIGEDVDRVY